MASRPRVSLEAVRNREWGEWGMYKELDSGKRRNEKMCAEEMGDREYIGDNR